MRSCPLEISGIQISAGGTWVHFPISESRSNLLAPGLYWLTPRIEGDVPLAWVHTPGNPFGGPADTMVIGTENGSRSRQESLSYCDFHFSMHGFQFVPEWIL